MLAAAPCSYSAMNVQVLEESWSRRGPVPTVEPFNNKLLEGKLLQNLLMPLPADLHGGIGRQIKGEEASAPNWIRKLCLAFTLNWPEHGLDEALVAVELWRLCVLIRGCMWHSGLAIASISTYPEAAPGHFVALVAARP